MIRHIANLGLLLSFATLAVTGVMSFVLPFSITTARVHLVFGLVTLVLVGMHLATRVSYFTRIARQSVDFKNKKKPQVPRWLVGAIVVVWCGLLAVAFYDVQPATGLVSVGYEARHKAEIFRAAPQTVYEQIGPTNRIASVSKDDPNQLVIYVEVEYRKGLARQPAAAVWAQTTGQPARMIETLFVDQAVAFSDKPMWNGKRTPRHHILPIWRFLYTDVNGKAPTGELDAVTSATPTHSFSVEDVLSSDQDEIVICLEFNAYGDTNEAYPDKHLGQPSVLYTANVRIDDEQRYYFMNPLGFASDPTKNGEVRYFFQEHGLTTAMGLVEKVIVRVERPGRE